MADLKPPKRKPHSQPEVDRSTVDINKAINTAKPKAPTQQIPPNIIKPLQLKIPEAKKNDFKAYAALRGQSMNTLFLEMFEEYKEKHA